MWWQAAIFAAVTLSLVTLWAWYQARVDARRSALAIAARIARQDEAWDHRYDTSHRALMSGTPTPAFPAPAFVQHYRKQVPISRWIAIFVFSLVYTGGVVGSFEFFSKQFACTVLPQEGRRSCGAEVAFNAALWPFDLGKEAARWAFEREGARLARVN